MSIHWKMLTNFPFSKVFVLGIILALLGLISMIISIIAFVTQSWGHYAGTGMWGGATILASGLTAIFVSQLRSLASVKTFSIFSFIAMFTSLIMIILSAGGLSLGSGFYSHLGSTEYNKRASILIHASLLVNSVFCLLGSILAVIVCCKYLVFERHDKPKCHNQNRNILFGTVRTHGTLRGGALNSSSTRSTNSRTPLNSSGASRRHSDNLGNRVQIEYWRCHKHSTSDQSHSNSHVRRQRHGHLDLRSNNTNLLSPCDSHDKRNGSRNSGHVKEVRGDNKERERLNIVPLTQLSNRPFSQVQIQAGLSRNPITTSPMVHLPTEFDEEELPPYEAVQPASNVINGSNSDSGDESDTENSSSTDAHSCNTAVLDEGGANALPVVEIQNNHMQESQRTTENSEHLKVTNCASFCANHSEVTSSLRVPNEDHTLKKQTHSLFSSHDHKENITNETSYSGGKAANITKGSQRPNRLVLSYINTQALDRLSVSPEICAETGDSLELSQKKEMHLPHLVQENFYENGPSYENLKCSGRNVDKASMNHLSKPSSGVTKTSKNAVTHLTREKETQVRSANPVKVSSPVFNTSPQLAQNGFGSMLSAFRPICVASSALSPHDSCSPTTQSSVFHANNDGHPHINNIINDNRESHNSSPHIYINAHSPQRNCNSISSPSSKYIEQGAIPKSAKHNGDANTSWKSMQPLSYNHFESASNESEKILPSKMIPFTDSKLDITSTSLKKEESAEIKMSSKPSPRDCTSNNLLSSSVPSSSVLALKSLALPVSLFGTDSEDISAKQTKLNNNSVCETANTRPKQVSASSAAVLNNVAVSLVREASTQVNSVSTSRWHSRRMGGNQTLLQSRQEELQNSQMLHRTVDTSGKPVRPSSMPLSGGFSGICHGISGLVTERQFRNRSSEVSSTNSASTDSTNPQPIGSYLANHIGPQPQSLALRQNHLLQNYPLQPQQPRLGVQLHQRRQQQHQLQQNIESQQQHQQMQQLQQPQQGNQQNLQGRSGRPLFSVLL